MPLVRISLAWIAICFSWHALADFPTAKSLFEKQEYQLAKPRLEKLAELGHVEAQFLVSRIYAEGLGTDVDNNKAYAWALIARDRDHPEAAKQYLALRRKLESRRDGKETFSELNSKYGKDALFGNLYPIANRFVVGSSGKIKATRQDEPSYPSYFERGGVSAWAVVHYDINEDGKVENAKVIASFPVDGINEYVLRAVNSWRFEPPRDLYGDTMRLEMQLHSFQIKASQGSQSRRFNRDNQEYLDAIAAAAEAEFAEYQYLYAILAESNIVKTENPLEWYQRAAINGHQTAQYRLAQCLITGNGCDKDRSKAVNWLAVAAEGGNPKAAYLLAQELLDSNNVNFEPRKAARYLELAALQEYMPAIADYASLLAMSDDPEIYNPNKAVSLAEQGRAIDPNHPDLLSTLGIAFIELGQQGRGEAMLQQAIAEAKKRNWATENFEDLLLDYQTSVAGMN
ncbi:TonB family protein [Arsukibacterium sp.]|uniref:TonB family protein n=1 Tax=Arsukibacterium sp. TaxID=1977258 RepID=UPI001BD57EBF|nr:TonB family protein [Arsukibacterium sp.]